MYTSWKHVQYIVITETDQGTMERIGRAEDIYGANSVYFGISSKYLYVFIYS